MDDEFKIRPLQAKVIVRLVEPPARRGLIHLPEAHLGRTSRGTVVSVGPGREYPRTGVRVPPGVRPGDHVVFTPYADVPVDGSPSTRRGVAAPTDLGGLVAVSQEEILCVLEGACCPYPAPTQTEHDVQIGLPVQVRERGEWLEAFDASNRHSPTSGPCASCGAELRDLISRQVAAGDGRAARAAIEWWYPGSRAVSAAGHEFRDEVPPQCRELFVVLPAQPGQIRIDVRLPEGAM